MEILILSVPLIPHAPMASLWEQLILTVLDAATVTSLIFVTLFNTAKDAAPTYSIPQSSITVGATSKKSTR